MKALLPLAAFLWSASCKKGDDGPDATASSASLKIMVTKQYLYQGVARDSAVSGATVYLFNSAEDRQNNLPAGSQITGDSGTLLFDQLPLSHYWIRVTHPIFGIRDDDESTPQKAIALAQIHF